MFYKLQSKKDSRRLSGDRYTVKGQITQDITHESFTGKNVLKGRVPSGWYDYVIRNSGCWFQETVMVTELQVCDWNNKRIAEVVGPLPCKQKE